MRIRGDAGVGLLAPDVGGSVQAKRFDATPWRDPRVIAGVILVLASTLLGGLVVAAADDTTGFWAVSGDVRAGDPVRRKDLVAVRAKVPRHTTEGLMRTDRALPGRLTDLRWAADARGGTLLTEAALANRRRSVDLPIAVALAGVPGDLRRGDNVDIWWAPDTRDQAGSGKTGDARRLLSGVRVVSRSSATGITGVPAITLVVDAAGITIDGKLMGALSTGRITVVRVS